MSKWDDRNQNFATYPQDYYTGSQVRVYFGAIWVDDIATIQWQTNHSKQPLWGYADHQFRAVTKGQFLVNGQFTVAFKETGYLNVIMNAIKKNNEPIMAVATKILNTSKTPEAAETLRYYMNQGLTIEAALDLASSVNSSNSFGKARSTSDFEDIAEVLEDTIWSGNPSPARVIRSDEMDYGSVTGRGGSTIIDKDSFDILIGFGNRVSDNKQEHTVSSINGVHITGESMVISPAGEPLGMSYTFFARGYNEAVSNAWPAIDKAASSQLADSSNGGSNQLGDTSPIAGSEMTELMLPAGWPNNVLKGEDGVAYG